MFRLSIGCLLFSRRTLRLLAVGSLTTSPDHTHPAFPELFEDLVVRDGFADHGIAPSGIRGVCPEINATPDYTQGSGGRLLID